jgi:YQGE family putative transporter
LEQIALYNFSIFLCTALGYVLAGLIAKRSDRVYTLRIGIGLLAIFYVLILALGDRVGTLYLLLGSLLGFGNGFYWLSYNVLVFEVTEPDTRDEFNGANGFFFALASGIAPMVAGQILSKVPNFGYQVLFTLSFGFFLSAVLFTRSLDLRVGSPTFDLRCGFRPEENHRLWHQTLTTSFFLGFREGTLAFLPFLLVFLVTDSELLAGRYLWMTAVASLLSYYFVKRFLTFERRIGFVTVSAFMLGSSVLWLLIHVNTWSLFTFGIVNALFSPLLLIPYSCLTMDVMGRLPQAVHRKVEYLAIREVSMNTGRCLSILILVLSQRFWLDAVSTRIAFLLIGTAPLIGLVFFRRSFRTLLTLLVQGKQIL